MLLVRNRHRTCNTNRSCELFYRLSHYYKNATELVCASRAQFETQVVRLLGENERKSKFRWRLEKNGREIIRRIGPGNNSWCLFSLPDTCLTQNRLFPNGFLLRV